MEQDFKIIIQATFLHKIRIFICFSKTQEIAGGSGMHEFSCDGGSITFCALMLHNSQDNALKKVTEIRLLYFLCFVWQFKAKLLNCLA